MVKGGAESCHLKAVPPALDPIFTQKPKSVQYSRSLKHIFIGVFKNIVKTNLCISLFCGQMDESASHNAGISCDAWTFPNCVVRVLAFLAAGKDPQGQTATERDMRFPIAS